MSLNFNNSESSEELKKLIENIKQIISLKLQSETNKHHIS